ncbi:unnamed protein product [Somion occarium]|uniref:tRNA-splicing endonuclease subunit Sen34 n=1 Tax=Somion occarium TaxID=3059160 RepID=A0ABP1D9G1_9APHY
MATSLTRVVELRVSNHKAYVWDVDDIAILRAEHHICGVLTGTLPHVSQQNVFLGPPLILLPEEVVLLVQKEFAVLVDDPIAHHTPSTSKLRRWNSDRLVSIRAQMGAVESKEPNKKAESLSEEALRKRREREETKAAAARAKALAEGNTEESTLQDNLFSPSPSSSATPVPPAVDERPATPATSANLLGSLYTVTIPASSPASLPWYSSDGLTYSTLESAKEAGIWTYPSDLHERAKCGVFRDLWENGFYMGGGIRFGGDFLIYPGDPLRYHSHFVGTVIDSPTAALMPMEIVAHGRLGTATKKAHLLCGWDDEKQEVSYYSIEWAGFG